MAYTSLPRVNIQLLPGNVVDSFEDRKNVIFGQIGPGGAAITELLYSNVHTAKKADILALFGVGELYHRIDAWRSAIKVDKGGIVPRLDVVPVEPNVTGTFAAGSIAFSGTATSAGSSRRAQA